MTLLGLKLEKELIYEIESDYDNDFINLENVNTFLNTLNGKKYDATIIDETEIYEENLIDIINKIKSINKKTIILIVGKTSNLNLVASVIKAGAYEYILKPIDEKEILKIVIKAVKNQKLLAEKIDVEKNTGGKLIGQTKKILEVYKMIGRVSNSRLPVLVVGEKGTGKTSVANSIHQFSNLNPETFLSINCNSIHNNFLDRKLFGYEKDAFAGTKVIEKGELEKINGGTFHIGNIESLNLDLQAKILYLLQEGEIFRNSGTQPIKVDVRIIASTSENIEKMILNKQFIEELYLKLRILEIEIPPLRERKDDIPFIISHYIENCNEELNKAVKGVSKPAMEKIMKYDWPGNVNELKNTIKSAIALCSGSLILPEELTGNIIGNKFTQKTGNLKFSSLSEWIESELDSQANMSQENYYGIIISKVEKELIRQSLERTNGKKIETAKILGITRNTLRTKINNYDLN